MSYKILSDTYTKALLHTIPKEDRQEVIESILENTKDLISNPTVWKALGSPLYSKEDKEKIALKFTSQKNYHEQVSRFIFFIIKKNRLHLLPGIKTCLSQALLEEKNIEYCYIHTAFDLDPNLIESIIMTLKNKTNRKLKPIIKIDQSIIGGFKAVLGHRVFDGSLKNSLGQLKNIFVSSS